MKKTINILLVMAALFRCIFLMPLASFSEADESKIPIASSAEADKVMIPSLLAIPVIFQEPVTSNEIALDDIIPVVINEDIYVSDTLVFKKGTDGVVFIESRKKSNRWGSTGKIKIIKGKLTDVFGVQHDVKISENEKGDTKPSAKILPVVGLVVFWPLRLLGLKKGEQGIIPAGKVVYALTTADSITTDSLKADISKN